MKSLLILQSLSLAAAAQSGGVWNLTSSTLDGGGTVSAGGVWKVTSTIGQADASVSKGTGVAWAVEGGFWPGTVAEPEAPVLTISPLGLTRFSVAWGADAGGYKLQYSQNLSAWTDYPALTISGPGSVVWPATNGPRYYFRLQRIP